MDDYLANNPDTASKPPVPSDDLAKYESMLCSLVVMGASIGKYDLRMRWDMGLLMNEHLGSPTKRQPHGKAVLKEAARRLGTSQSELHRMRWAAHHFVSPDACQEKHPGTDSWAKVKKLLPSLRQKMKKGRKSSRSTTPNKGIYPKLARQVEAISSKLRNSEDTPSPAVEENLRQVFLELFGVANRLFKLCICDQCLCNPAPVSP